MTQAPTRYENYASQFQELEERAGSNGQAWLHRTRQDAWSRFLEVGFPTARRGNEKWKYTNVAPIANATFQHKLEPAAAGAVKVGQLRQVAPWNRNWVNLVFLDGRYSRRLSTASPDASPDEPYLGSLAGASVARREVLEAHLGRYAGFEDDGFTALNTAFLQDGALAHIPDGRSVPTTVHLVFVTTESDQPGVSYPRTLVVAGRHSRVTLVESYVSLNPGRYFTNAVTEMVLGDGAIVDHYRLLLDSPEAFHVGTSRVYQGQDSSFTSGAFAKGAALGRNDFQVLLDAPGAFCSLNGLYLTRGTQHMDNLINIDHAKPHGTSRLFYKGILDDRSRAVFGGTVMVRKDAQKTDAQQTDKNLILSEHAEVDSKPSLLIYADDVKCGHGATAGHVDEDTLFYMRSRGLDPETAGRMLIHAFASEVIDTVQPEPLRAYLDRLFSEAIPSSSLRLGGA